MGREREEHVQGCRREVGKERTAADGAWTTSNKCACTRPTCRSNHNTRRRAGASPPCLPARSTPLRLPPPRAHTSTRRGVSRRASTRSTSCFRSVCSSSSSPRSSWEVGWGWGGEGPGLLVQTSGGPHRVPCRPAQPGACVSRGRSRTLPTHPPAPDRTRRAAHSRLLHRRRRGVVPPPAPPDCRPGRQGPRQWPAAGL